MKESAKNKDGQWYAVEQAVLDEERVEMGEIGGSTAILRANLYDKNGTPVLIVVEIPMDGLPVQILEQFRQALTVQQLTPVMMVPPQVRFMQLRPVTNAEIREIKDCRKKVPETPPEPSRIIMP